MDAVPLEMDDIFEERPEEGEEDQLPQMLPDLPEGLESEIQGTQNDDETGMCMSGTFCLVDSVIDDSQIIVVCTVL